MFWFIIIISTFIYIKYSLHKKSNNFEKLLQNLNGAENIDATTLTAITRGFNLINSDTPFDTVLHYTLNILKNKKSTTNDDPDVEFNLDGQISLFEPEPTEQDIPYTPPTPLDFLANTIKVKSAHCIDAVQTPKIKPKKVIDLDTSLIVLILGVILVQVSAIIFSTTIWNNVDSFSKIGILLVLSLINLVVSKVFYTRFETKSPSSAFYILGYSFASFSVISAGYFFISNDITKIFVDTSWLLTLVFFFILICYFSYLGFKIYAKNPFLWIALFSTDLITFFLSKAMFNSVDITLFILSVYAVIFVYILNTEKIKMSTNIVTQFSTINLLLISFLAMTGSITTTLSNTTGIILILMTCCILSSGFLLSHKNQFNSDTSSICFCLILVIGLFKIGFSGGLNTAFLMACFLPLTIFVFKLMNILDEELQNKLNFVSLIFSFFIFFFNSIYSFNIADPSLISLITLIILFVSVTILNNSSGLKNYQYVHPVLLTVIVVEFTRLLDFTNILTESGLSFVIATLLFGIFLFYTFVPKLNINTFVSQNIFPITLAFICLNTEYKKGWSTLDYTFMIYFIMLVIACYVINTLLEKNKHIQYLYATLSVIPSLMLVFPLYQIFGNDNIDRIDILSILIFIIAVLMYYLSKFDITKKFLIPINIIYGIDSLSNIWTEFIFPTTFVYFHNNILYLFISIIALYLSQRLTKQDSFILKYVFPFVLVFEGLVVIAHNTNAIFVQNNYYIALIGVVAIAAVLLKPKSTFILPLYSMIFLIILNGRFLVYDNNIYYLLVVATIVSLAIELYKEYSAGYINDKNNIYKFILISILLMISPSITITQLVISACAIGSMYLITKFPDIIRFNLCLNIFNIYLNVLLFVQAFITINKVNDNIILSSIMSCLSLVVIMLIGNNSNNKSNFCFGLGSFFLYLIMMENISDLLYYNLTNISRELRLTLTIFSLNIALYFSKYLNLDAFAIASPRCLIVKETVKFNIFKFSITLPVSRIDFSSFVGILGIIKLLGYGYHAQAFILLSLYFLNFTRRSIEDLFSESHLSRKLFSDITLLSCSVGSLALALLTQDFITIPKLYRTEYEVLVFIAFITALRYLWKEKLNPTTYFVTMICTIVRLFLDVMSYEIVFDAIILGVGIICLLLYGLHFKRLRVVVLTVTSLLLLITYISFAFWNSPYWFAYLILTGIFLISLSVYIENKKRKDKIDK